MDVVYDILDEGKLWKAVSGMSGSMVELELQRVMKVWKKVCKNLFPAVLHEKARTAVKIDTGCRKGGKRMWRGSVTLYNGNIYAECEAFTGTLHKFRFGLKSTSMAYDEFESREKAKLYAALKTFGAAMFSGDALKFSVLVPGNLEKDDRCICGCHVHAICRHVQDVTVIFPRCESVEEIILTIGVAGIDLHW